MSRHVSARSLKHFRHGSATVRSANVAELYVALKNVKILSVAQFLFYGAFGSPATLKHIEDFT